MEILAEDFSEYFISKIIHIPAKLDEMDIPLIDLEIDCAHSFSNFAPMSEDDIRKLMIKSLQAVKSSALDPVPTNMRVSIKVTI